MTPDEGGRKKPCTTAMQLMCFSKTWDCSAFVDLLDKEMAMPGEDASMDLRLVKPMVLEEGQQFTIRDSSGTIGTGRHQSNTCLTGSVSCNRSSSLFRFNIQLLGIGRGLDSVCVGLEFSYMLQGRGLDVGLVNQYPVT